MTQELAPSPLARQLVYAGLGVIVLIVLPGLPNAFTVPKEGAVYFLTAFVFVVVAMAPHGVIRPWPRWWNLLAVAPACLTTLAALANGIGVLSSDALRIWGYVCFGLGVRLVCKDEDDVTKLLALIAALAAMQSLLTITQILLGDSIMDFSALPSPKWYGFGTLGNPNWVGSYLATATPIALHHGLTASTSRARIAWRAAALVILSALLLTFSRGAIVAAVCAVIGWLLLLPNRPALRPVIAMILIATLAAAAIATARFERSALAEDLLRSASVAGRARIWRVTAAMIAARPVRGWGPGGFRAAYPEYQRAYLARSGSPAITDLTDHPHNEYLYAGSEAGIGAILAFAGLVALALAQALRPERRAVSAPAAGATIALVIHGMVDIPFHLPLTSVVFCLCIVGLLTIGARAQTVPRRLSAVERGSLVLLAVLLLAQGARVILVDARLGAARRAYAAGNFAGAAHFAQEGLALEQRQAELWAVLAATYAATDQDQLALDAAEQSEALAPGPTTAHLIATIERRHGRLTEATAVLTELIETVPGMLRPRLLLSELYLQAGDSTRARAALRELLALPAQPGNRDATVRAEAARRLQELSTHE